jgi:hypothetical protein
MMDEGDFIDIASEFDRPIMFTDNLIKSHKEDKKKKKKKKKYIRNIFGEFVECEDDYEYDYEYEILRYPIESNPPNPDYKLKLGIQYMVINQIQ